MAGMHAVVYIQSSSKVCAAAFELPVTYDYKRYPMYVAQREV
jgi:hypothetical protein